MINKLLIYEQQYDVVGFYHVIDKEDLEAYAQNWIKEYVENANKSGHITYKYISHKLEDGAVDVQLEHGEYLAGGRHYPSAQVTVGFNYIELDKMPRLVPETLELKK